MTEKIIYTDCDGVLLDWEVAFHEWMSKKGLKPIDKSMYKMDHAYNMSKSEIREFIKEFNNSAWMIDLPVFRDAHSAVARLVESGYKFHVITSMSEDDHAKKLRVINLENHFGKDAFSGFTFLDTGADKDEVLAKVPKGAMWIEDKDENAIVGKKLGLNSVLIAHEHNIGVKDIPRYVMWNEIADKIL